MVAQQSSGTGDSVRITAKHSTPDERGTAYDLIDRLTGSVRVGPVHGRHELVDEPFTGDLTDRPVCTSPDCWACQPEEVA